MRRHDRHSSRPESPSLQDIAGVAVSTASAPMTVNLDEDLAGNDIGPVTPTASAAAAVVTPSSVAVPAVVTLHNAAAVVYTPESVAVPDDVTAPRAAAPAVVTPAPAVVTPAVPAVLTSAPVAAADAVPTSSSRATQALTTPPRAVSPPTQAFVVLGPPVGSACEQAVSIQVVRSSKVCLATSL